MNFQKVASVSLILFFFPGLLSCDVNASKGSAHCSESAGKWVQPEKFFPKAKVQVVKKNRILISGTFFLADTPERRTRGLMRMETLPEGISGAVFVFEKEVRAGFWMKDTSIPLYILFFGKDGRYLWGTYMEPFSTRVRIPPQKYLYALELPAVMFKPFGKFTLADFEGSTIKILNRSF